MTLGFVQLKAGPTLSDILYIQRQTKIVTAICVSVCRIVLEYSDRIIH